MNQEDKETEDWLALLAGKQVANADPKLVWEANALRAELAYRRNPPTLNPKILDNVLAQLPPVKPSLWEVLQNILTNIWSKLWEQRLPIGAAMATSVLMVIAIWHIIIPQPMPKQPNLIAKPLASSQTLPVPNPQATAKELQADLEQLGISATITQKNEVWILEATDVSPSNPKELSTLLKKYKLLLPPPPEKQLTVHIKKSTTP